MSAATEARGLVLDANILIRCVLGSRARELLLTHVERVAFFAPIECFEDARTYLPDLLSRRGVDPVSAMEVLDHLEGIVRPLSEPFYIGARAEAMARIEARDPRDWPVLAAALTLNCPIWTEDQDFFGTGVPTWTTDRVELYLNATQTS